MHQEGRLFMGHLHAVIQGTGHGTRYHTTQGTGGKDDDAQQPGEKFGCPGGPDDAFFLYHDIHETFNAAGALDQVEHGADQEHGHDDDGIGITGKGFHDAVKSSVKTCEEASGQDEVGQEDTYQQCHKHVFQSQRQDDRYQRWHNR